TGFIDFPFRSRPVTADEVFPARDSGFGGGLFAVVGDLSTLAICRLWTVRGPTVAYATICDLFFRRRRGRSARIRARTARFGRRARPPLGRLGIRHACVIRTVDRSHGAD